MVLWFAREAHDTMVRTWIDVHQRTAYAHKHTLDSLLSTLLGMTSKDMIVDRSSRRHALTIAHARRRRALLVQIILQSKLG